MVSCDSERGEGRGHNGMSMSQSCHFYEKVTGMASCYVHIYTWHFLDTYVD